MINELKIQENVDLVTIDKFKLQLNFTEDSVEICIGDNTNNKVLMNGNTYLNVKGDFFIGVEGELGIATKDAPISIDSINSKLYLNSINAKKSIPKKQHSKENIMEILINKIDNLEKRIGELECQDVQD